MKQRSKEKKSLVTVYQPPPELLIELPPIDTPQKKSGFMRRLERFYANHEINESAEHLKRVIEHTSYLFNGIEKGVVLRLLTLKDLGATGGYWSMPDELLKQHGLKQCDNADALRLAVLFENIQLDVPEELLKRDWRVHMSLLDFPRSGDLFVQGLGCPLPVFTLSPSLPQLLRINWVYQGDVAYHVVQDYEVLVVRKM